MKSHPVSVSFVRLLMLASCLLWPLFLSAHTVRPAVVTVNLGESREVTVRVRLSAEQLLAGIGPEYADTNDAPNAAFYDALRAEDPAQLEQRFVEFIPEFLGSVGLRAGAVKVPLQYQRIDIPPVGDSDYARDSEVYLAGRLPRGTSELTWAWPQRFGSHVLRVVGQDPESITSAWLQPGEQAEPYRIENPEQRGRLAIIADYIGIGFAHIMPLGLDHIAFVLGLFLLSLHLRPLLWQISAFTVAHTITLGMSIYGLISLSPAIVEPLIALSIIYVGVENCLHARLKPSRVLLVFGFGLLHGMGFAGVLAEIGLPQGEFLTALISFNVGVELGQLTVIGLGLLALGWWRNREWYRRAIVVPGSVFISVIGSYWLWNRVFG